MIRATPLVILASVLLAGGGLLYLNSSATADPSDTFASYIHADVRIQTATLNGDAAGNAAELTNIKYVDTTLGQKLSLFRSSLTLGNKLPPLHHAAVTPHGVECKDPTIDGSYDVRVLGTINGENAKAALYVPKTDIEGLVLYKSTGKPVATTVQFWYAEPGKSWIQLRTVQSGSNGLFKSTIFDVAHGSSFYVIANSATVAPTGYNECPSRSPILHAPAAPASSQPPATPPATGPVTGPSNPPAPPPGNPGGPAPAHVSIPVVFSGTVTTKNVTSPVTLNVTVKLTTASGRQYSVTDETSVSKDGGSLVGLEVLFSNIPMSQISGQNTLTIDMMARATDAANRQLVETKQLTLTKIIDAQGRIEVHVLPASIAYLGITPKGESLSLVTTQSPKTI